MNELQSLNGINLIYLISYDFKDASSAHQRINDAFMSDGFMRDAKLDDNSLPRNFYASRKTIMYNPLKSTPEDAIKQESQRFHNWVIDLMEMDATSSHARLFTSVSDEMNTGVHLLLR
ncbi:hypothetical protein ACOZB2_28135 [Pantoea endophytica]|uniref:Uncharacterized protein n=1 Tax=Pantoea sp. BJ2 TaxID=3141322 RepID=A0AAU7U3L0_9GAMM